MMYVKNKISKHKTTVHSFNTVCNNNNFTYIELKIV